jgi:hypothetical protein
MKLKIEMINKVKERMNNLTPILIDLEKAIKNHTLTVRAIPDIPEPIITSLGQLMSSFVPTEIPAPIPNGTIILGEKEESGKVTPVYLEIIGDHQYFCGSLRQTGLYQHQTNPNVFYSLDPALITDHLSFGTPDEHKHLFSVINGHNKAADIMNTLHYHTGQPLTYLVLKDKSADFENNFGIYAHLSQKTKLDDDSDGNLVEPTEEDSELGQYHLDSRPFGTVADVTINYFDADASLGRNELDVLLNIYEETLGRKDKNDKPDPKPLLIHCSNALDRTMKIAFAFELLDKFDTYFEPNSREDIKDNLVSAYHTLISSISPDAFPNIKDVQHAVKIAFRLKIIAMERQALQQVEQYVAAKPEDDSKKADIDTILTELSKKSSASAKAFYLTTTELSYHSKLLNHQRVGFLLNNLPATLKPSPKSYTFLEVLRAAYKLSEQVESPPKKALSSSDSLVEDEAKDQGIIAGMSQ